MASVHRAHWLLEPSTAFLNHGSFGACPAVVLEEQARLRRELEREPVQFLHEELPGRLAVARSVVAELLGASASDLVFTSNATEGVNAVLRSLEFAPGDEILVTDHGYRACINAARYVAAQRGAVVRVAAVPFPLHDPEEVVQAVVGAVSERTRLALIDHVTSPSALVFPVERIVRELARRGVDTLVDGAHAPGMVDVDLAALGAAYYAANFHKWCCAPKGSAALWVHPSRQGKVAPPVISHGWALPAEERFQGSFDWTGTRDPTAWLCVPRALEFLSELLPGGLPALRAHNRALALTARRLVARRLGVAEPSPPEMIGSLAALKLALHAKRSSPGRQLDLYYRLRRRGYEALLQPWPDEAHVLVRVSAQIYNEPSEYEAFAEALAEELAHESALGSLG